MILREKHLAELILVACMKSALGAHPIEHPNVEQVVDMGNDRAAKAQMVRFNYFILSVANFFLSYTLWESDLVLRFISLALAVSSAGAVIHARRASRRLGLLGWAILFVLGMTLGWIINPSFTVFHLIMLLYLPSYPIAKILVEKPTSIFYWGGSWVLVWEVSNLFGLGYVAAVALHASVSP